MPPSEYLHYTRVVKRRGGIYIYYVDFCEDELHFLLGTLGFWHGSKVRWITRNTSQAVSAIFEKQWIVM